MPAVRHHHDARIVRVAVQHLKAPRPADAGKPGSDRCLRDAGTALPKNIQRTQGSRGIERLVQPRQGDVQSAPLTETKVRAVQPGVRYVQKSGGNRDVGSTHPLRLRPDDLSAGYRIHNTIRADLRHDAGRRQRLVRPAEHHRNAGLDDARLLGGYLFRRVSQIGSMIHGNAGNDRYGDFLRREDIGRVQPPAHADLEHHEIAGVAGEKGKSDGGYQLKLGGHIGHAVGNGADACRNFRQLRVRDRLSVQADALVERNKIG